MDEVADDNFYLPDEYWELVFKFLIKYDSQENNRSYYDCFKSLSLVSKQFLSITNRVRYSLTIGLLAEPFLPSLFHRFPNLTSLNLLNKCPDNLLCQISTFSLNITSLRLRYIITFPTNGLRAFSQNITTLTSLTCTIFSSLRNDNDMFLIADCFPNLKRFDYRCFNLCEVGIAHVLRRCCNIRYLNLNHCLRLKLSKINFELPELKVLNLTCTRVDDETLYVISKNCHGLLKLLLNYCRHVTEIGVKHVAENCTQLREINLRGCGSVHANVVASMISSRPSLKKITAPPSFRLGEIKKPFKYRGCVVCFS